MRGNFSFYKISMNAKQFSFFLSNKTFLNKPANCTIALETYFYMNTTQNC